jgi:hypothetical protein
LFSDVSATFVSDDTLVLLVHRGELRDYESRLFLISLAKNVASVRAEAKAGRDAQDVNLVSDSRIVVRGSRDNLLFSARLDKPQKLPVSKLVEPFPGSKVVGEFIVSGGWRVIRLDPTFSEAKEGPGRLESLSDQTVVYRFNNTIIAESYDGSRLGSFPAPSGSGDSKIIDVAGSARLYLSLLDRDGILDVNGKLEQKLAPPPGWGFRHGWSNDGGRILYDNYKRTIATSQKVMETFTSIATLGLGVPPEQANGEEITVLDSRSGRVCFHLDSPGKLLGFAGSMHASIAPSGRWIAVATPTELSVYPLPEVCLGK